MSNKSKKVLLKPTVNVIYKNNRRPNVKFNTVFILYCLTSKVVAIPNNAENLACRIF